MAHPPFTIELSRKAPDGTWEAVHLARTFDTTITDGHILEFEVPWDSPDRKVFQDAFKDLNILLEMKTKVLFQNEVPPVEWLMAVIGFHRIDDGREGDRARVRLDCILPITESIPFFDPGSGTLV